MLIISIQNDANGTDHSANYDFSVNINRDTIAHGRIEAFDRDLGWKELVRQMLEEADRKS